MGTALRWALSGCSFHCPEMQDVPTQRFKGSNMVSRMLTEPCDGLQPLASVVEVAPSRGILKMPRLLLKFFVSSQDSQDRPTGGGSSPICWAEAVGRFLDNI